MSQACIPRGIDVVQSEISNSVRPRKRANTMILKVPNDKTSKWQLTQSKENSVKLHFPSVGCPSQVLFVLGLSQVCPRLVFHMSLLVFFVLQMSSCCPCFVLGLPLSLHKVLLITLSRPFIRRRLLVGLWKVYKKATFDPHQVICLSLEMVDLNMSATSPL